MDRYFWLYKNSEANRSTGWQLAGLQRNIKRPLSVTGEKNADYPGLAQVQELHAKTEFRYGVFKASNINRQ